MEFFFCQDQASRRAGKQARNLQFLFPKILAFSVVIIVKYPALISLGKFLADFEQVITEVFFIFTEVWPYIFDVSWSDFQKVFFFLQ